MKPVLQYLKSNALLIAILGVLGYQHVMLSQLVTEGKWDSMILGANNKALVALRMEQCQ